MRHVRKIQGHRLYRKDDEWQCSCREMYPVPADHGDRFARDMYRIHLNEVIPVNPYDSIFD